MANTVVKSGKVITFSAIDTDINLATLYPEFADSRGEVSVRMVAFEGNAADVMIVHNEGIDGAVILSFILTDKELSQRHDFGPQGLHCKPVIDQSDLTIAGTEYLTFIMA